MLKYKEVLVGFSEVPNEITLCINITGCPIHCVGCHSPHLWENTGENLTKEALVKLINANLGITCVAFMGGDAEPNEVIELAQWVKEFTNLAVCWYRGTKLYDGITDFNKFVYFDYIKTGPYIPRRGGLNSPDTNQRFYKISFKMENGIRVPHFEDITFKFKNNETDSESKSVD